MAEEKNYLQTIKLEISRNFKLIPYERLAFHRLLGLMKSGAGLGTLVNDLQKGPHIRESAISVISKFATTEAIHTLIPLLKGNISVLEKYYILDQVQLYGDSNSIGDIIDFIEISKGQLKENPDDANDTLFLIDKAFEVLKHIGEESNELLDFILLLVRSDTEDVLVKSFAIKALSAFKSITMYEDLLKLDDNTISYAVYKSLYGLICKLVDKEVHRDSEDERLYTYNPDSEDKIILDIRVLLGKMASRFDTYSTLPKIGFVNALIACNHREYLIYIMKALTSKDTELVSMMLYTLYSNINRIRDPDKLFRNLLSISNETKRDNELIVDTFIKYFTNVRDTRQFHLLQDKLYSYIIVTLETYFETYRKDFMITDVIEKSFPESFQRVRKFIIERLTPELKRNIVGFLSHDDSAVINHIIDDLSKWITYVPERENEDLKILLDILYDHDKRSRENSASRIEDLNFEKRYLRDRIVRLCKIIERLKITDAATALVNIYNYLKKYPDEDIMASAVHTLSVLNYSYMLGEIEVSLTTGNDEDKNNALSLLSLFTEQRSLNIIFEFINNRPSEDSIFMAKAVSALIERDIQGNGTASQIFKTVIENNSNKDIRSNAILGIGKCCFEADIEYLNNLFFKLGKDEPKDVVVRALGEIIANSSGFNRRQLIKNLQEYLKDPGIKVRTYSCILLAHLGSQEAFRSIRDMLIIKNKDIQRDMLTILIRLESLEFAFFLVSLLKEEYGITRDIIPVLETLSEEDIREIDGFVINLFRKFERPDIEGIEEKKEDQIMSVESLDKREATILNVSIFSYQSYYDMKIPELIDLNLWVKAHIVSVINENNGIISAMSTKRIISYFPEPAAAAQTSLAIRNIVRNYNRTRTVESSINVFQQIITDKIYFIGDEIADFPRFDYIRFTDHPFVNRIVINQRTYECLKRQFNFNKLPELALSKDGYFSDHYELMSPINFVDKAEDFLKNIADEVDKKNEMQQKIEAEIKKLRRESRSSSSVAIAKELDEIGNRMQNLLDEIERYVQRRSTDRELIRNVRKMLANVYNLYKVEISRIIID